jgi:hypothetical protein
LLDERELEMESRNVNRLTDRFSELGNDDLLGFDDGVG